jgi:hypothetical protein
MASAAAAAAAAETVDMQRSTFSLFREATNLLRGR